VRIKGANLGESTGNQVQVFFSGALPIPATRPDDQTLLVTVPPDATTGRLLVLVSGATSNQIPFRVIKSLSLNQGDSDLLVGRSLQYVVSATDTANQSFFNPAVAWAMTSGNSIRMDSGTATGVTPGDSTIRVSSGNLSLSRQLHVFSISSVSLNKSSLTLNAMPDTGNPDPGYVTSDSLTATVTASDRPNRAVTWSSSNTALVTVDGNGALQSARTHTPGTAVITATSADDPRVQATASVTVTIKAGLNLDIQ
jgi:hypothetical protein